MSEDTTQPQERDIAFWESQREITHDEAKEAAARFIDGNFKNDNEPPRISIPANPDRDDDLVLMSYIAQQRRLRAQPSPREVALEKALQEMIDANAYIPITGDFERRRKARDGAIAALSPAQKDTSHG